ncbi:glycosyltransferase family 2 protein [Neisseria leonii]|uniref:glycosyltransferase family 2 protein n=1 Tax=Neisseria leonii TaxID=2995413 RepID=UPI00237B4DE7|nr:glycosyltransferase family 2 protein [Neisseria sp. 3986]MDD9325929.1 glycosyltransferase family 2 protein [Neisseria sp. 3986]
MEHTVSVLIMARNEQHNIEDCIKSCTFADEIIVIDDFSTDETARLAEALGARVIRRHMDGDFGGQQMFAVGQARCPWVLFLDADERISPDLAEEIRQTAQQSQDTAYWIRRHNRFRHNRATHGTLRPDYVCRLLPAKGIRVEGLVHQAIVHPYRNARLKSPMFHYTYDNWDQYFGKFNAYTRLSAEKYREAGKPVGFFKDIILRPFWAFIKVYLFDRGFLDGRIGWIFAVNHYFYTMTKYVRLYYLYRSNGKL